MTGEKKRKIIRAAGIGKSRIGLLHGEWTLNKVETISWISLGRVAPTGGGKCLWSARGGSEDPAAPLEKSLFDARILRVSTDKYTEQIRRVVRLLLLARPFNISPCRSWARLKRIIYPGNRFIYLRCLFLTTNGSCRVTVDPNLPPSLVRT